MCCICNILLADGFLGRPIFEGAIFSRIRYPRSHYLHFTMNRLLLCCCAALWISSLFFLNGCARHDPVLRDSGMPGANAIILNELIYTNAPFPSCHASTIAETPAGLVASWFGGTDEGENDVGIWVSRKSGVNWSAPIEVAQGRDRQGAKRLPCWNPVLFQAPKGPLLLFYKVGPDPKTWWGMVTRSSDQGKTWSSPELLPEGFLGPIKNKPVLLANGTLLCGSSTEHDGWVVHLERTDTGLKKWEKSGPLNRSQEFSAIQPAILVHSQNRLQMLCRSKQKVLTETWSDDGGKTWSSMVRTSLPNPSSGADAVRLKDGRFLLVYNHTNSGRTVLNVGVSDDGKSWRAGPVLEQSPGEYSYPAIIQSADGLVHITYTWKRQRIKHAVIDPRRLAK